MDKNKVSFVTCSNKPHEAMRVRCIVPAVAKRRTVCLHGSLTAYMVNDKIFLSMEFCLFWLFHTAVVALAGSVAGQRGRVVSSVSRCIRVLSGSSSHCCTELATRLFRIKPPLVPKRWCRPTRWNSIEVPRFSAS